MHLSNISQISRQVVLKIRYDSLTCVLFEKKNWGGGGHNCQNILICNTNYQQFLLYASSGSVGLISTTLQSLKNKLMRQLKEFINFILKISPCRDVLLYKRV